MGSPAMKRCHRVSCSARPFLAASIAAVMARTGERDKETETRREREKRKERGEKKKRRAGRRSGEKKKLSRTGVCE